MKKNILIVYLMMALYFVACNDSPTSEKSKPIDPAAVVADKKLEPMPVYDPAMDPIKVEAQFAKVLADTLNIKMYEVTLKPGDTSLLHTHPDYTLYVLQGGKIAISANGVRQEMELKAGMGIIFGSISHSAKNIGNTTIKLLANDIYRPRK